MSRGKLAPDAHSISVRAASLVRKAHDDWLGRGVLAPLHVGVAPEPGHRQGDTPSTRYVDAHVREHLKDLGECEGGFLRRRSLLQPHDAVPQRPEVLGQVVEEVASGAGAVVVVRRLRVPELAADPARGELAHDGSARAAIASGRDIPALFASARKSVKRWMSGWLFNA